MRELNETERRVIEVAAELEQDPIYRTWYGPHVLFRGWPAVKRFRTKDLGITAAIQTLARRGLIERQKHGGYRLAPPNALAERREASASSVEFGVNVTTKRG